MIGAKYTVPLVDVGVLPSVVYRIVAPPVVEFIDTLCAVVYVPPATPNVGVATVPVIVYDADATPLSVHPAMYALAVMVEFAATENGPMYTAPLTAVGVDPSVVYRIVAPAVAQESVTVCAEVYVPAAGAIVGAATASVYVPVVPGLSAHPVRYATAFSVVDTPTVTAPVYSVPTVALGAVTPSVVYRMLAPAVPVVIVTLCAAP